MPAVHCACLLVAMSLAVGLAMESTISKDGYATFPCVPESRYKLFTESKNWTNALKSCEDDGDGSHLVIIDSLAEAAVVKQYLQGASAFYLHVGINDKDKEGTWRTIKGDLVSSLGYNVWGAGQPDTNLGHEEDCGCVDWNVQFQDFPCDFATYFLCEKANV